MLFLIIFMFSCPVFSEVFINEQETFAIDFPEGFAILQNDGDDSFHFRHTQLPVDTILRIYPLSRYTKASEAMDGVMKQLKAECSHQELIWRNSVCCLGTFNFNNKQNEGWAFSVELPLEKGILVLLVYTQMQFSKQLAQFQVSILDSLAIDRGSFYSPGPVTTYAYPSEGDKIQKISIAGIEIETQIGIADEEACRFVIEREYAVLSMYVQSKMRDAAWQRYYKMIYRDSYSRFRKPAFDIYNALFPLALKQNSENPDFSFVQMLLSWTQDFEYTRDRANSDFSPLPVVFANGGSDCDSRAMLLSVLLSHMNYKTMLFISPEYQHALFGIAIDGKGARLKVGDTNYLLGETTAKVALGLVPAEMSDIKKWLPMLGE
ncbi:MAG: hypothetical protein GX220_04575 [Treponema sp.]|nr:hypothetical protein [Treponema sp.]